MRKNNIHIHELIQLMGKNEKRYLKLFIKRYPGVENNKAMKLFDHLSGDEEHARQAVTGKRPDRTAAYLQDMIIKGMVAYRSGYSVKVQLRNFISFAELLIEKGAYRAAERILKRAAKMAFKAERFNEAINIIECRQRILPAKGILKDFEKKFVKLAEEKKLLLKKINNIDEYRVLSYRLSYILVTKGLVPREQRDISKIKALMKNPLLKNKNTALSGHAMIFYHYIYSTYYYITSNTEAEHASTLRLARLFEAFPTLLEVELFWYIVALNNIMDSSLRQKRYDEFMESLERLKALPSKVKTTDIGKYRIIARSQNLLLSLYIQKGEFEKGLGLVPSILEDLKKHGGKVETLRLVEFYHRLSILYFAAGKYDEAKRWTYKILNMPGEGTRDDLQSLSRIMLLIIHLETDNKDQIDSIALNTFRYLSKRKLFFRFEKIMLRFTGKILPQMHTEKDLRASFREMRKELQALAEDPFERRVFQYFDFISWLDSKIENRPFAEVVRKKA